jgi:hypothetical protein
MTRPRNFRFACTLCLLWGLLLPSIVHAAAITTAASGLAAADIQTQVDAFRAALGNPNNGNNAGPLAGGRREINWDGGGAVTPSLGLTPFTVFENTRGSTMTTPGTGFIQAAPADLATQFGNATYSTTFAAFSPLRLFVPIGSNVTDVTFSIPGSGGSPAASVSAFGAIFSDVDTLATTMEFFDPDNSPLGVFTVPEIAGDATFSFLGVQFNAGEQIGRVHITTGNTALGPTDGVDRADVVVMDDFLYSEPVPEPGTFALVALGITGLGAARRGRGRAIAAA